MFDWDDQELANIIWGEGREDDDHIVPYPEDIEKKVLTYYCDNEPKTLIGEDSKHKADEKDTSSSTCLDGSRRDKNDGLSVSGVVGDSQLEIPSFSAAKTDDGGIGKKSQLDTGSETSPNHTEDKELVDLVGNSWVSIGSFDDLDRIFSKDELDCNTSLGSTDELWSSPRDLLSGLDKSSSIAIGSKCWEFGALGNTSANIEINSEYLHNKNPSVALGNQTADSLSPHLLQKISRHVELEENVVGTAGLVDDKIGLGINVKTDNDSCLIAENFESPRKSTNKEKWSKTKPKQEQVTDKRTDSRLFHTVNDLWPSVPANVPHLYHQRTPSTVQNDQVSYPVQQQFSQEFSPLVYQHFTATPYGTYAYADVSNQHSVMDMLKPTEDEHQSILSNSEATPGDIIHMNKLVETTTKTSMMTPQEKIEKLRRRQQMRAMLAIQKQQERLGHQASTGQFSASHKSSKEDAFQSMEKCELETNAILNTMPCYDPGSLNKGDDCSRNSSINDYSVEDTVLGELQNMVSRLDMKIRLCIRDSLYRLAHSATQRHFPNDQCGSQRSGTNEHSNLKEETSFHERFVENSNVETETNHIDRAVAHLLFHQPLKFSVRHVETPESSTSTKVSTEQEAAAPRSLQVRFLAKRSENECNLPPYESISPRAFADSQKEDASHYVSQKVMKTEQTKEITAECAD